MAHAPPESERMCSDGAGTLMEDVDEPKTAIGIMTRRATRIYTGRWQRSLSDGEVAKTARQGSHRETSTAWWIS